MTIRVCVIDDREHTASSLLVKEEICSQNIQTYTTTVSAWGGRGGALRTGTARVTLGTSIYLATGYYVRDRMSPGVANLVPTF